MSSVRNAMRAGLLSAIAAFGWALLVVGCGGSTTTTTTTVTAALGSASTPTPPPAPLTAPITTASIDAVTSDGAVLRLHDGSVYSVGSGDQSAVSAWSSGDLVSIEDASHAVTNLSTGEKVPVTYVGDTSDTNTYADTGDHSQSSNSSDGSIILLDDGSIWSVAAADQGTTAAWADASSITANSAGATYELVNTDSHESAAADYIGQE